MIENELVERAKKTWGIEVSVTKTFGNKIYSLIGIGYKEYIRTDLDNKKVKSVKVGTDKKGKELYATYYFGYGY